ncbi:hypothetical protein LF845_03310 [Deferribacterales bacterium Es71-Z0220]|jgi:hypothetical protein|uniref:hypothetical protein n=1 Tax=Deferrivibrio essentukiensis TaxID=2880922 RepID=UPI001F61CF43|nr:hypothetical protein [Deferrivibrio essentukiensis]MCB4203986.1 hypothetical protein [Deferrivibrio essentukiensis]
MVKVEIFYNSGVDTKTPDVAEDIKYKFGSKVDVRLIDLSSEKAPEEYGIINPPEAVVDGKKKVKLDGEDSLKEIISKVIF